MALDLTLSDYFKIAMSSGIVATIVTTGINAFISQRQRLKDAIPELIEAANALDGYAVGCQRMLAEAASVPEECWETQSYDPLNKIEIRDFEFRKEMPWGALKTDIISALKGFPEMITASRRKASARWDYAQMPVEDALPWLCGEIATVGLHALSLATKLRSIHGIPLEHHQLDARHIVENELKIEFGRYADLQAAERAQIAEMANLVVEL